MPEISYGDLSSAKAGIAEVFEALRQSEVHPPLEFAVSREEEVGLKGVKAIVRA